MNQVTLTSFHNNMMYSHSSVVSVEMQWGCFGYGTPSYGLWSNGKPTKEMNKKISKINIQLLAPIFRILFLKYLQAVMSQMIGVAITTAHSYIQKFVVAGYNNIRGFTHELYIHVSFHFLQNGHKIYLRKKGYVPWCRQAIWFFDTFECCKCRFGGKWEIRVENCVLIVPDPWSLR